MAGLISGILPSARGHEQVRADMQRRNTALLSARGSAPPSARGAGPSGGPIDSARRGSQASQGSHRSGQYAPGLETSVRISARRPGSASTTRSDGQQPPRSARFAPGIGESAAAGEGIDAYVMPTIPIPDIEAQEMDEIEIKNRKFLQTCSAIETLQTELAKKTSTVADVLPSLEQLGASSADIDHCYIITKHGLRTILGVMKQFAHASAVQIAAFNVLSNATRSDHARLHLEERDVITQSIEVLDQHEKEPAVCMAGLRFLVNLSLWPDQRKLIVKKHGLKEILDITKESVQHPELICEGLKAVVNLSFVKGSMDIIIANEGFEMICEAMNKNSGNAEVQGECMRALYNLSYQNLEAKHAIVNSNLIPEICNQVVECMDNEKVVFYGTQCLANLAIVSEEYRKQIKENEELENRMSLIKASEFEDPRVYMKVQQLRNLLNGNVEAIFQTGDALAEKVEIENTSLPLGHIVDSLKNKVIADRLSGDLLLYVVFLIAYVFFMYGCQVDTEPSYYTVAALSRLTLGKEFPPPPNPDAWGEKTERYYDNILNADDWYTWFIGVAIDQLWPENRVDDWRPYRQDFVNMGGNGRYAIGQNMLLASMRVRTLRMDNDTCTVNPDLYPANVSLLSRECFDSWRSSGAFKKVFHGRTPQECKFADGSGTLTESSWYPCGGYEIDIPFSLSRADAISMAMSLNDSMFVDNTATRFVAVEFFTYAPQFQLLCYNKLFCEVFAGGNWKTYSQLRTFQLWAAQSNGRLAYDVFFFILVCFFIRRFFTEFATYRRINRGKNDRAYRYFLEFWNIFEAANLVNFIILFGLKWTWMNKSRNYILPLDSTEFPNKLVTIQWIAQLSNNTLAVNTLLTFLKTLKYLQMNDNFNVLSKTLARARLHVIGVLIIFAMILLAFALCGMSLFGSGMAEFRNLSTSFSTLLRFLVGDRQSYDDMKTENQFLAGIYYWMFCILGLFLYLNFFVSILMEDFKDVKKESMHLTLDKQAEKLRQEVGFMVSLRAFYHRLQLLRRRKTLSAILQEVYDNTLLPHRVKLTARRNWSVLRSGVFGGKFFQVKQKNKLLRVLVEAQDTYKTEQTELTCRQFKAMIPQEHYKLMGDIFFNRLWEEFVWQHDVLQLKEQENEEQKERARRSATSSSVDLSSKMRNLTEKFGQMRKNLQKVENLLGARISVKRARTRLPAGLENLANRLNPKR